MSTGWRSGAARCGKTDMVDMVGATIDGGGEIGWGTCSRSAGAVVLVAYAHGDIVQGGRGAR